MGIPRPLTRGSILVELDRSVLVRRPARIRAYLMRNSGKKRPGWLCTVVVAVAMVTGPAACSQGAAGGEPVDPSTFFQSQVQPILKVRCLRCHGGEAKIRGNLRLDRREAVLQGGDLGPAVSLEQPEESVLLKAIRYEQPEMPPSGKLPQAEIDILTRWVKEGLHWAPGEARAAPPPPTTVRREPQSSEPRSAWPYGEIVRPPVPRVSRPTWVSNPIDAFILARLEAEKLQPAAPADRVALIRRATYDLTGLPPTPEEVDAFLADTHPDADESLVDRLLASTRYGETWGRHWLDLVRYGETNGYERDSAKPFAWRYRDYVIRSLNDDKPYDRFVHEQLAGDLIAPDSSEALTATGFYRLGLWDDEPADRPLAYYDGLDGIVSTTGQVFLGISINCARCHDHKKDPIPQRDYYRMLAFFRDLTEPNGKNTQRVGRDPGLEVMCVREWGEALTYVLLRGNPRLLGDRVEPGVPAILGPDRPPFPGGKSKRRALADWLTDRRNPMTARVLANRLWQYHFGRGIVPTPNDFGRLGEPPTHPELLDWLAAELMEGGWRLKRLHRMIMLSQTYRTSSRASAECLAADPGNLWFGRFPMRRLGAEEVRDSILAVSGALNDKAGGPSVCPPIPKEVLAGQSMPGSGWAVSSPAESARRSVYVHVKRSLAVPILATHDAADTDASCPVRYTTTVPTQALGLLNGGFARESAARFARRLEAERPRDRAAQVRRANRLATGPEPPSAEVARDVEWLERLRREDGVADHDALAQYCLMLLNTNAFVYLD
jgi:hypothetical protein